jgi:tRNA-(ms[2]io[6]A)-hydroxylase
MEVMREIRAFLSCDTPTQWVEAALKQLDILLIDHAHCEKKAASTAMNLLFRYVDRPELLNKMSRLAREELIHFEQVLGFMQKRGIAYEHLSPSRYAQGLRQHVRTREPERLVDTLIIGALIEARSCERFAALAPRLVDEELSRFYQSLLKSEGRHYQDYLGLARQYSPDPIDERIAFFAEQERGLILSPDATFRFHSGVPETLAEG